MGRRGIQASLVGALLQVWPLAVGPQTSPTATSAWLGVGVGGSAGRTVGGGVGTTLDLTVQRRRTQVTLRMAGLLALSVGVGLQAWGNLKSQAPFAGLGVVLRLGRMPRHIT
jgi:hypothetical protein